MERGDGFYLFGGHANANAMHPPPPASVETMNSQRAKAPAAKSIHGCDGGGGGGCGRGGGIMREQDHYMPIANVIRIMRRILPAHAKISDDAKETIQECVSEYISFITGEANDRCQREQRKTITAEDVLWAMGKLGFDDYVEPLTFFLSRYRDLESDRSSSQRDPVIVRRGSGAVGEQFVGSPAGGVSLPVLAPYLPTSYNMVAGDQQGGFYDHMSTFQGYGYYRDGSSGAGGSSAAASRNSLLHSSFDPYSHLN